ncbi:MAG: DNA mismatch repair protein MutS [Gemmatimonadota bacterium]
MIQTTYSSRAARFEAERDRLRRASRRLSNARLAVFVAVVALGLLLERRPDPLAIAATLVVVIAFIALIAAHRRTRERERWNDELVSLNREGLHRLSRAWEHLPIRTPPPNVAAHAYAADLDLYGHAALTQILGPVGTAAGAAALDRWLLQRDTAEDVRLRQQAARELAPMLDLRETLAVHARRTRTIRLVDLQKFLHWAESPGWLRGHRLLRAATWLLPGLTWLLIVLHATGVLAAAYWLVPLAATLALYFTAGSRARATFDEAFGREAMFAHYPQMLEALADATFQTPLLRSVAQRIGQGDTPAHRQLAELQRLMHLADLRLSSIHVVVFLATMWDFHVLRGVERWQRAAGEHARDWLDALGETEALAALATLAHDQPDWCFAELLPHGHGELEAVALGHPLIADEQRVANDVRVGPPGTFLLVTGSNMSGKSTLLRAIGCNVILAQAGAPCCARSLRLPPLDVYTSIRVQDSLARGVSYFMAELERLKQVVDAADRTQAAGESRLLFLLDEILHGTNTAERRIAARRVIRHLVDSEAIGAATTHDLSLAEEPAIADAARLVHFQEHFEEVDGRSELRFDYQLRDGIATSTNALHLMRLVGLP